VARRKNTSNAPKEGENGTEADLAKPAARPSSYLVGPQIDEALANGEELDIFWPFEGSNVKTGGVADWTQAEALW
jgi:actin-related protein 9